MPSIPFLSSNSTQENQTSNPLPEPIQKGVDTLEQKYTLPLWMMVLIGLILVWIAKR